MTSFISQLKKSKDCCIFSKEAKKTREVIKSVPFNNCKGKKILIFIESWDFTTSPFFQIIVGALLSKNNSVSFILDDMSYGTDYGIIQKMRIKIIESVLVGIDFSKLSGFSDTEIGNRNDWIDYAVSANSIHEAKGEFLQDESYIRTIRLQLEKSLKKCLSVKFQDYDLVMFPGGLCQDSNFIVRVCKEQNVDFTTFDCGLKEILMSSYNGIAAQLGDIPSSLNLFLEKFGNNKKWVELAENEFYKRKNGKDKFSYQLVPVNENKNENVGYLLMMNSVWDSAALGIHTTFSSYKEWVFETIEWVLKNTHDYITIREHPADRFSHQRSADDYKGLIFEKYGNEQRVRFISATETINSYNLMENAKCILVYSSTVALEAVLLGKSVICVSNSYYSDMGFVKKSHSKEQYFNFLQDENINSVSDEMKEKALAVYFLTQCCNFVPTVFTPSFYDFDKFSGLTIDEIQKLENVDLYIESLETGVPISFLLAKRKIESL